MDRIVTYLDPQNRNRKYFYDPAGDLIERTTKHDEKTRFVWDANEQLIESTADSQITVYRYDALTQRISEETNGVITRFYWDGDALLGDIRIESSRDQDPAITRQREWWVYYPGTFEPLAMVQGDKLYFYHTEPNGCLTRLLDEHGKVVWAVQYAAWGKVRKLSVNEVDQPLRLQGQFFDEETGLHYNRFRYYCPNIGAFVSQDPLGLIPGENVYRFAPNVFKWVDPMGLAGYIFRGDNGYIKGQPIGKPIQGDITAKDLFNHVDENGDGRLTSFSQELKIGNGSRGADFFGSKPVKVSRDAIAQLESEGKIRTYTAEQVRDIIEADPKFKGGKDNDIYQLMKKITRF